MFVYILEMLNLLIIRKNRLVLYISPFLVPIKRYKIARITFFSVFSSACCCFALTS